MAGHPSKPPVGRRRFVQGIAAAGAATALPPWSASAASPSVLSGTEFQLEIAPLRFNVTGRTMTATAINGQVPGPTLRFREGDTVTLAVTNRLAFTTSIHWHGLRIPSPMDGVPGFSFNGIAPGETFVYRYALRQSGTYWYHAHGPEEQTGVYGSLVIEPKGGFAQRFDRDYVVVLSDWSDESPLAIISNLKFQSTYYNYGQRTLGTFIDDIRRSGLGATVSDRLMWGNMRMAPTDILDVSGATYTYLMNGRPPAANWTALFHPGERVRLRFIDAGTMSIFDVRVPGLPMTVVQTDGNDIVPVTVDEFRIGPGETYDVIVEPREAQAYTIFAQAQDRTGYARGTLAPRSGMSAAVPPMDPRPMRTMADMGMEHGAAGHGAHGGTAPSDAVPAASSNPHAGHTMPAGNQAAMPGMQHSMPGMEPGPNAVTPQDHSAHGGMPGAGSAMPSQGSMVDMSAANTASQLEGRVGVDNVAMAPKSRLSEAGDGLDGNGRRVLLLSDLRNAKRGNDLRPPTREIVLHLTGNMERFMWSLDGIKFSDAAPIMLKLGERVRFTLINDTMMDHPMHLHGVWSELENGQSDYRPYKHTILVKPGEKLSFLVSADEPGRWAFHCHLLYHMELGMMREVRIS
ncbi:MAG: copper resistance system multicopper oxidase [Reyranella sp.]|uniref:Copper-resistance protein, CopA family n=1 Tax=Enhydrobacter aerosaccus TaxID=225324 RepID=A0A1T4SJ22_9HYPH|nr:copper resistance system multicopper oxidase [Enhydrobacter aerosaccus]KAF0102067.1 MAG: copA [Rhodospirillaceae bacterium]TBR28763.1 MAG: copper resistance system multicopper oxidase [Reyranella sp.]SKA28209.1 copper-resistance protein, CopA family [Enhydrobacter aerosaccus]